MKAWSCKRGYIMQRACTWDALSAHSPVHLTHPWVAEQPAWAYTRGVVLELGTADFPPRIIHQFARDTQCNNSSPRLEQCVHTLCRHYVENYTSMWTMYIGFGEVDRFIANATSCQLFRIGNMCRHCNTYTHNQLSSVVEGLHCRFAVYTLFVSD